MSGNVTYYYLMSGLEADGSPRGSKSGGGNNNNNGNNQSKKNKDKKAKKPKYELTRSPAEVVDDPNPEVDELQAVVEAQANIVRELKSGGADHDQVAAAVEVLKALKAKLEVLRPGSTNTGRRGKKKGKKGQGGGGGGGGGGKQGKKKKANVKGQTKLGMSVGKEEDFSEWFTQAITKAEMIEYYDVSGCYILRPWSFQIWERVQRFMDGEFASLGVENAYFPLFVSSAALTREKDHVEGFAPEVAWVTKSGESELPEPIAVRPTSETIIYPAFAKWIQSHAQLPMRVNQWCSVVRWEMKHCVPFLRSREFLWQEGHTAHATCEDADQMVQDALDVYARTYADLYAVPMIKGVKSEKEKFAGGFYTTTVEGIIPTNGRAIQAATSHNLGQNFAKMFDIKVENPNAGQEGEESHNFVWQTSWGFTTRSVGVMIMVHGDDKGLVLPPRVAPKQVVFVPIFKKDNYDELTAACEEAAAELEAAGVRCAVDARKGYKPGWKFNHWELKGVPVRIEIGARDLQNNVLSIVIRHSGEKLTVGRDGAASAIVEMLDTIHDDMLAKATAERDACLVTCEDWSDFIRHLDNRKVCLVPWCNTTECEEDIKTRSGDAAEREGEIDPNALSGKAKTLCIPYDQPEGGAEGKTCIGCGNDATCWVLLGRSY